MDSNERECAAPSKSRPTRIDEPSWSDTGPTCPGSTTCEPSSPTLFKPTRQHGVASGTRAMTAGSGLICSAADSPAKISRSPDAAPDSSGGGVPRSFSSFPESLTLFGLPGSSLKMYPASFPRTVAEISPSYRRRWSNSGMALLGASWILDTSEWPRDAEECSLSDVLERTVPSRFFLSSKACRGILRRAAKRGRTLPPHLLAALEVVAQMTTMDSPEESSPSKTSDEK